MTQGFHGDQYRVIARFQRQIVSSGLCAGVKAGHGAYCARVKSTKEPGKPKMGIDVCIC
jgi:hypothetical protein